MTLYMNGRCGRFTVCDGYYERNTEDDTDGLEGWKCPLCRQRSFVPKPGYFLRVPQDGEDSYVFDGYDRSDPKHPEWHSTMSGIWDNREKGI